MSQGYLRNSSVALSEILRAECIAGGLNKGPKVIIILSIWILLVTTSLYISFDFTVR